MLGLLCFFRPPVCSHPFPEDRYAADISGSSFKRKRFPMGPGYTVSPTCSSTLHMVLQGSKCQNITGLWNVTGRLGCFHNFCCKYQSQIQQSCQGFQATLFCLKTTSVQPCTSTPSKSMFSLRYFLQDLQIIMLL